MYLAPAVYTQPKTLRSSTHVIREAAWAWRGVCSPIPVVHRRLALGWICGSLDGKTSTYVPELPASLMPFPTYDSYVTALTGSSIKRYTFFWAKPSDGPVVRSWYDWWPTVGLPQAGNYTGSARTARSFTDASAGTFPHGGNVTPSEKFLARFTGQAASIPRTFVLYDRVLDYPACTMTASNQTMTNSVTAPRYIDLSKSQPGLQLCLTADTVHNATAANLTTLAYTDVNGSSQNMPTSPTVGKVVSAAAPTATLPARVVCPATSGTTNLIRPFLPLANPSVGAKQVDNYTWSAAPTGTFCLALVFPIAWLSDVGVAGIASDFEYSAGLMKYATRIYDGAALSVMGLSGTTTDSMCFGNAEFVWT